MMNFNTVFIHIPRTGGIALKWALNRRIKNLEYINQQNHRTALERLEEIKKADYSFTIVRNPWDRAVSWYYRQGKNLSFKDWILCNDLGQSKFFICDNIIVVSDVFKYEDFDDNLAIIQKRAGWPLPNSLRIVNNTIHDHYRNYYDEESKNIVYEQCRDMIELFNYTF